MNMTNRIYDIEREIEEAKIDISWSENKKTIEILEEKINNLEKELEELQRQLNCKELREDGSCTLKDDIEKQHCIINSTKCCAYCNNEIDNTCNSKKGVCTRLF